MDNRTLQRLVSQNAQFISNLHFDIEGYVLAGKHFKSIGERSFAEHQYKLANKARSRLAPAVSTQLTLKAEIRWNDHVARLNRQVGVEEAIGVWSTIGNSSVSLKI